MPLLSITIEIHQHPKCPLKRVDETVSKKKPLLPRAVMVSVISFLLAKLAEWLS